MCQVSLCYAGYFVICIIITYVYVKIPAIPLKIGCSPPQNGTAQFKKKKEMRDIYQ